MVSVARRHYILSFNPLNLITKEIVHVYRYLTITKKTSNMVHMKF